MSLREEKTIKTLSPIYSSVATNVSHSFIKSLALLILVSVAFASHATKSGTTTSSSSKALTLKDKLSGKWKFQLKGEHSQESVDVSDLVSSSLKLDLNYKLANNFKVKSQLGLKLGTGQAQSRFDATPTSTIYFSEMAASFDLTDSFELQTGAINQKDASTVVSASRAFLGLKQKYKKTLSKKDFWGITAEQTIPTSFSLNTTVADQQATPSFNYVSVFYGKDLKDSKFAGDYHKRQRYIHFGVFNYNNLGSVQALEGRESGNSTNAQLGSAARLSYEFSGFDFGAVLAEKLNDGMIAGIEVKMLQNNSAPDSFNRGAVYKAYAMLGNNSIKIEPKIESFFFESDVAPAAYMTRAFAGTNRKGTMSSVSVYLEDLGFQVRASYLDSLPINKNAIQDHVQSYELFMETYYAEF